VPRPTIVEIPLEEQVRMRAELRRARYGYLLALHLLLLCAAGRTPSEVARVLFCSRSSMYRILRAYRAGTLCFNEAREQAPSRDSCGCSLRHSHVPCKRCSRLLPVPMAGVGRGGAVPR